MATYLFGPLAGSKRLIIYFFLFAIFYPLSEFFNWKDDIEDEKKRRTKVHWLVALIVVILFTGFFGWALITGFKIA